jgi:hypothetical protein
MFCPSWRTGSRAAGSPPGAGRTFLKPRKVHFYWAFRNPRTRFATSHDGNGTRNDAWDPCDICVISSANVPCLNTAYACPRSPRRPTGQTTTATVPRAAGDHGHIRSHGVRHLLFYCSTGFCHHSTVVDADRWPDDTMLLDLNRKAVCTKSAILILGICHGGCDGG